MTRKDQVSDRGKKGKEGMGDADSSAHKGHSRPDAAPARSGKDFGQEGTNKTIPVPKPDGAPSEELGNTPHIEKSPYTRG